MNKHYTTIPPILSVKVEDNIDVMIVRDTARRAASLLGFAPASQAQLAGAASVLAELVLKTRTLHEISFNGVQDGPQIGIRVSCVVSWLATVSAEAVTQALQFKIGKLVNEVFCTEDEQPIIVLMMWLAANSQTPNRSGGQSD